MDLTRTSSYWSGFELNLLTLRFKAGMRPADIAEAHGRSLNSVLVTLDRLQLIHFKAKPPAWHNSTTGAVWLPYPEERARTQAEREFTG